MNHEDNLRSKAAALGDAIAAAKKDGYEVSVNPADVSAILISETGKAKVLLTVDVDSGVDPALAAKAQTAGQRAVDKVLDTNTTAKA